MPRHQKKFLKYWFPVILYSGIIFYVSSLPNLEIPLVIAFSDKLAHAGEYAVLGFLVSRALAATTRLSRKDIFLSAVALCVLYGTSDEFHQIFVPGRDSSLGDLLADGIGAAGAGYFYTAWNRRTALRTTK